MKGALRDRAFAEDAAARAGPALHFIRQREPDCERQAGADDRIAADEARARIEEMHRAAAPARAALLLAIHLRHDRAGRHAADQRVAVLAIRGDDRLVLRELAERADGDGFLADVEMEKAADLRRGIKAPRISPQSAG